MDRSNCELTQPAGPIIAWITTASRPNCSLVKRWKIGIANQLQRSSFASRFKWSVVVQSQQNGLERTLVMFQMDCSRCGTIQEFEELPATARCPRCGVAMKPRPPRNSKTAAPSAQRLPPPINSARADSASQASGERKVSRRPRSPAQPPVTETRPTASPARPRPVPAEELPSQRHSPAPIQDKAIADQKSPQKPAPAISADRAVSTPELTTGMRDDLRSFFRIVIGRSRWTRVEFAQAAEKHAKGLGFDAAIEEINNWALDRYGDSLLQLEGQFIHVELPFM